MERAPGQGHRLGGGGGFVQQRCIGDVHPGEVGAHRLEVDQRFHPALRDLRLVRRVGGVPGRVLEDVAQDHVRHVGAVIALADEAAEHLVLRRDRADPRQRLDFADRIRQRQRGRRLDRGRHDGVGQRLQRVVADHLQHGGDLAIVRADVAFDEGVVVLERAEGRHVVLRKAWAGCSGPRACIRVGARRLAACAARKPCSPIPVLLPESLEARGRGGDPRGFLPLRRRRGPVVGRADLSRVCPHGGLRPERFRAVAPSAARRGRKARALLPPCRGIIPRHPAPMPGGYAGSPGARTPATGAATVARHAGFRRRRARGTPCAAARGSGGPRFPAAGSAGPARNCRRRSRAARPRRCRGPRAGPRR